MKTINSKSREIRKWAHSWKPGFRCLSSASLVKVGHIFKNVPLFRCWVFRVVFFYIPIYGEYWALPCNNLKANIKEEKTIFRMAKSVTRSNIFNGKKNMECLKLISTDILVSFPRSFSYKKTCICFIDSVSS